MANYISRVFGASPVAPMQDHMDACYKAARQLIKLFEAVVSHDWKAVAEIREKIVALEQQADEYKKQIRGHMPKSLFMPVPREDLLNLLWTQDQIANTARDISGNVLGRQMTIPKPMQKDFLAFVERNADAAKMARKSVRELDELYASGFRGAEAVFIETLVEDLDRIENETDEMQAQVRGRLFDLEDELPPVDVMFLYRVIEMIGEIGDMSERIGRRLELLLAH